MNIMVIEYFTFLKDIVNFIQINFYYFWICLSNRIKLLINNHSFHCELINKDQCKQVKKSPIICSINNKKIQIWS